MSLLEGWSLEHIVHICNCCLTGQTCHSQLETVLLFIHFIFMNGYSREMKGNEENVGARLNWYEVGWVVVGYSVHRVCLRWKQGEYQLK